jgi:hypothetical protein
VTALLRSSLDVCISPSLPIAKRSTARVDRATSNVNASNRGPSRTTAYFDGLFEHIRTSTAVKRIFADRISHNNESRRTSKGRELSASGVNSANGQKMKMSSSGGSFQDPIAGTYPGICVRDIRTVTVGSPYRPLPSADPHLCAHRRTSMPEFFAWEESCADALNPSSRSGAQPSSVTSTSSFRNVRSVR